jgi:hypothetical protein
MPPGGTSKDEEYSPFEGGQRSRREREGDVSACRTETSPIGFATAVASRKVNRRGTADRKPEAKASGLLPSLALRAHADEPASPPDN